MFDYTRQRVEEKGTFRKIGELKVRQLRQNYPKRQVTKKRKRSRDDDLRRRKMNTTWLERNPHREGRTSRRKWE